MLTIQTPFTSYAPYTYSSGNLDQTSLVRPYESVFRKEIIETNFYRYYRSKIDELVQYYQKNAIDLTEEQEEPLKNILDLL